VIDQSYADYTLAPMLEPKEMTDVFNLMLVHSLSKKFCIPGLRLGYIVASPIIIGRLKQIRQPWTINALAIEAGKYLLENDVQMMPNLKDYLQETMRLHQSLSAIDGLKVMKTDTNFMLASIENSTSAELKHWLLDHYGILIRDASNIRGLDGNYFRITTQKPEENDQLVEALTEYTNHLNEVSD
jgi:threonine-phosphate decarboxylase